MHYISNHLIDSFSNMMISVLFYSKKYFHWQLTNWRYPEGYYTYDIMLVL